MLLLSEGDVDLEDFNDVIETSLSLLSTVILVSLASLMTSISESERYRRNVFGVSTCMHMLTLIYADKTPGNVKYNYHKFEIPTFIT